MSKILLYMTKGTSIFQEGLYHSTGDEDRVGLVYKEAKEKEVHKGKWYLWGLEAMFNRHPFPKDFRYLWFYWQNHPDLSYHAILVLLVNISLIYFLFFNSSIIMDFSKSCLILYYILLVNREKICSSCKHKYSHSWKVICYCKLKFWYWARENISLLTHFILLGILLYWEM